MSGITRYAAPGATRARAVAHDGRVFTVATSPDKSPSIETQTRAALAQLDRHLAEAGTDRSRLLSVTVYLADIALKPGLNAVWDAWVDPASPPQRACVGAALEGDDLVEFVAVAALPPSSGSGPA